MSTTSTTIPRRVSNTLAILKRQKAVPTTTSGSILIQLDSATPTPTAHIAGTSNTPGTNGSSQNTCTTDSDCASDSSCLGGSCVNSKEAGLLGSGSEATGRLDTTAAVGIGVGAAGFIVLMIALGYWVFKIRNKQHLPPTGRIRSQSNDTAFTVDNDQKTLVASMPNSPQHPGFSAQQSIPADFYVGMGAIDDRIQREEHENSGSIEEGIGEKSPTAPSKALPPAPIEQKRYALNVSINKSMLFDEEAARMVRENIKPRDPVPRYRFKEILPPIPTEARKSFVQQTKPDRHNSEYKQDQPPTLEEPLKFESWIGDDFENQDQPHLVDRRTSALSRLEGAGPPSLSLPDLRPPSPSFSFRSYDWYQDIIGDQTTYETPTTPTIPHRSPARTVNPLAANPPSPKSDWLSAPYSPGLHSPILPLHLHPSSAAGAASPTIPNFKLSPTVYQTPIRSLDSGSDAKPSSVRNRNGSLSFKSKRTSRMHSQMTQRTHNSRSWLPEDGLYLPEEGTQDTFEMYVRRPNALETGRPESYSPLV